MITIAGNGISGFSGNGQNAINASIAGPQGVTKDVYGNIYIAEAWNNVIRKIDNVTGIISTFAGNTSPQYSGDGGPAIDASFSNPVEITFDLNGNFYITDVFNNAIRKVDPSGIITTVAGNGGLGYSGDGNNATNAEFYYPFGVAVDLYGNIYHSNIVIVSI